MVDNSLGQFSPSEQTALDEHRQEQRYACNIDLRVAAYDGVQRPERLDYMAMESRDVSRSGLSYYSPKAPDTPLLVLMIGDYRDPFFVTAKVVRCEEGFWNRRRQFVVGCRLIGQISYRR